MSVDEQVVFNEPATVCEECDWINTMPPLQPGQLVRCQRCGHVLVRWPPYVLEQIIGCGCSALLMSLLAVSFPFMGFSANGAARQMSLLETISVLLAEHFTVLGVVLCAVLFVLPLTYLVILIYLSLALKLQQNWPFQSLLARWFVVLEPWLMVDVFLVGVLVSLVKLHSLAQIQLGLSFWAFCGYVVLLVRTVSLVDRRWFWHNIGGMAPVLSVRPGIAKTQHIVGCHYCGAMQSGQQKHCLRCGHAVHSRRPASIRSTVALLAAAFIMYLPANLFPIMNTTFLGTTEPSTILGGVVLLWGLGSYPVAIVIFIASVMIPLAKMLALGWLCWQSYFPTACNAPQNHKLYRMTELIGRWSMIDVFVVAILAALVRLGNLMSIIPGPAALSFAGVVILTMIAAMIFDPRLLWDRGLSEQETSH